MKHIIFSSKIITDKHKLHSHLKQALSLPEWYGANLDALADCLGDISEETAITVLDFESLKETIGTYADSLKKVLKASEQINPNLHISL